MNPFRNLSVRASMALFSAVALGAILFLTAASIVNLSNSGSTATLLAEAVESTRIAGDLDMAHDAINGVVLRARLEGATADAAAKKALQDDLGKATNTMGESISRLEKTVADPALQTALAHAKPDAVAYMSNARDILAEALQGPVSEAKLKDFDGRFDTLEKSLAKVTESSEGFATATIASSKTAEASSRNILVTAAVLSLGLTIACALLFSRTIMARLGADPRDLRRVAQGIADNDLNNHIQVEGDATSVAGSMFRMQENLGTAVKRLLAVAQSVAGSAGEIAASNDDLAHRTVEQASSLEKTAAAMVQLGTTVRQNADNAKQANTLAQSASEVAKQGGDVVAQVVDTMKGINDASRKISDIISVIDGIAFQTNILALNAAVEAARAGEQGRGFAVVATEVRTLAGRSAEAAKEIKSLINASVERVEHGTDLVDRAGATMNDVVNSIRQVTDIVGAISLASAEQASGVADIGNAVDQLDGATQQNATMVEEMARSTVALNDEAQRMLHIVGRFRHDGRPLNEVVATSLGTAANRPMQLR
jgi:methyl-accepting chemotaxis protein